MNRKGLQRRDRELISDNLNVNSYILAGNEATILPEFTEPDKVVSRFQTIARKKASQQSNPEDRQNWLEYADSLKAGYVISLPVDEHRWTPVFDFELSEEEGKDIAEIHERIKLMCIGVIVGKFSKDVANVRVPQGKRSER